jgi:hypothetical protein
MTLLNKKTAHLTVFNNVASRYILSGIVVSEVTNEHAFFFFPWVKLDFFLFHYGKVPLPALCT